MHGASSFVVSLCHVSCDDIEMVFYAWIIYAMKTIINVNTHSAIFFFRESSITNVGTQTTTQQTLFPLRGYKLVSEAMHQIL